MPGDQRKEHRPFFACGIVHTGLLISDDRRQHPTADQPEDAAVREKTELGRFYQIDSWQYEPDQVDVPDPINQVPGHLEFAQNYAQRAMNALHVGDHQQHERWIHDAQQSLAWALSNLADHLERRGGSPSEKRLGTDFSIRWSQVRILPGAPTKTAGQAPVGREKRRDDHSRVGPFVVR